MEDTGRLVCLAEAIGPSVCSVSMWKYGVLPPRYRVVKECERLERGRWYRLTLDAMDYTVFQVADDGTVVQRAGQCAFKPSGGPSTSAERARYDWPCGGAVVREPDGPATSADAE